MILENKRHICLCAAALTAGILLAGDLSALHVIPAVLLLCGCLAGVWPKHQPALEHVIMAVLLAVCCILGFGLTHNRLTSYEARQHAICDRSQITVQAKVTHKEIKSDSYLYYLKQTYLISDQKQVLLGKVILSCDTDSVPIGAEITASGTVQLFSHARNDGNFDFSDYYKQQMVVCRLKVNSVRVRKEPSVLFPEYLYRLQKYMVGVYTDTLNERDAGILCTLAAGSKGQLDAETKQMYQEAGISHLLSVSGLHISILGFTLYRFLRFLRRSYPFSAMISSALVICFAGMSGFGIPARRAVVMYLCLMGAQIFGRTYDGAHGLALAVIILLLLNPLEFYQSGFLFSFTAILAIVLFQSLFRENKNERKNGFLTRICTSLQLQLWLQLWLVPLTAWFYFEVPLYALFLNLLLIPFASWLLGSALFAVGIYAICPAASGWLLVVCHEILNLYEAGMKLLRLLPENQILCGRPEWFLILIYYIMLAAFCLWKRFHLSALPVRSNLLLGIVACAFLTGVLLIHPSELPGIYFLDVGQGDGIFLTDGADHHILIDGGSSSESSVGTYRMLPFLKYHRVASIDAWIITHPDTDHISGLQELLEQGYPVKRLLVAKAMAKNSSCRELAALAAQNGTRICYVESGSCLYLQEMKLQCIYPGKDETATDINGLSQVWYLKSKSLSVLFTGDLGAEQEQVLLERQQLCPVTVLKVAHHGSRYSSCEEFLAQIQPQIAVISSSAHNRYHHPAPETLERLQDTGAEILCTKSYGQISVVYQKGQWQVRCRQQ